MVRGKNIHKSRHAFYPSIKTRKEQIKADRLMQSMDLDELLSVSAAINYGRHGEKSPLFSDETPKAKKYTQILFRFYKDPSTKRIAMQMHDALKDQIIEVNSRTVDPVEAEKLYREFTKKNHM